MALKKFRLLTYLVPVLLLLLFISLTKYNARRAPWYERALWNVVEPPAHLVSSLQRGVHAVWNHYVDLIGVAKENDELLKKIQTLQGELILHEELRLENERLKELLRYQETASFPSIMAKVLVNDPRGEFKSITLNRGLKDGVDILMPVLGRHGLLGRIAKVSSRRAIVLLIDDPNSAVDVMVQRSRDRSLLVGGTYAPVFARGYTLTRMEYLSGKSDIQNGDIVVTSGFDRVFPEGIPVGTVVNLETSNEGIFRRADVAPFENFDEVQEVLVVQTPRLEEKE